MANVVIHDIVRLLRTMKVEQLLQFPSVITLCSQWLLIITLFSKLLCIWLQNNTIPNIKYPRKSDNIILGINDKNWNSNLYWKVMFNSCDKYGKLISIHSSFIFIFFQSWLNIRYHIFCCNTFVFACPIIAKSQCWLFDLRANFALEYPYLPRIQLPVSEQWSQRLLCQSTRKYGA